MSKEFQSRPSHLLGILDDPYTAWCVDEACYQFGSYVEGEVQKAATKTKNKGDVGKKVKEAINRALTRPIIAIGSEEEDDEEQEAPRGQFKDPASKLK